MLFAGFLILCVVVPVMSTGILLDRFNKTP